MGALLSIAQIADPAAYWARIIPEVEMTKLAARIAGRLVCGSTHKSLSTCAKAALVRKDARSVQADLDREYANDHARSHRVHQNGERVRELLRASPSEKPRVRPRNDLLADRDRLLELQGALARGDIVRLVSGRGGAVEHRRYPLHQPDWDKIKNEDANRRRRGHHEKLLWAPSYDHTGPLMQAFAWGMALEATGGSMAFTLHLTSQTFDRARSCRDGAAQYLLGRIRRSLRKVLFPLGIEIPDIFFAIEASTRGAEHLHGAIFLPGKLGAYRAIRKALVDAAGFTGRKLTGSELRMERVWFAAGWAEYLTKWLPLSRERVGSEVLAASNGIRTAGREWYESARAEGLAIRPEERDLRLGELDLLSISERVKPELSVLLATGG